MKFEKFFNEARFKSPLKNFEEVSQPIEVRMDPLTGRKCRINIERTKRPKQISENNAELDNLVRASREKCYFCPERLESSTPKFPAGMPERVKVGKATVFPNLFPFGGFHAVGVFSDKHYLSLNEFTPEILKDCFAACIETFEHAARINPELRFWNINWNCLPPGAASIIHPHVQIFADAVPTPYLKELIDKSQEYHSEEHLNFWHDLIDAEKRNGERYIHGSRGIHWLASYAPQGNKEVMAVVEDISTVPALKEKLYNFCDGLSKILKGYHEMGVRSMTFSTFAGPTDVFMNDFYWLNTRLISRPNPSPFYISDCGFMEKMHLEPVIETLPEDLASGLKKHL